MISKLFTKMHVPHKNSRVISLKTNKIIIMAILTLTWYFLRAK